MDQKRRGLLARAFAAVADIGARRDRAAKKAESETRLRRIAADLERAAVIQQGLLPKASPRLEGFDIDGFNVPCYEVGGDYFDFVPIDADRLGVVIADVSGKGVGAALHMAALRSALRAEIKPGYDPARVFARLNDLVAESAGPGYYVTLFYIELDRRTAAARYVNAGHPPPLVLGPEGRGRALSRPRPDFPLGMFAGTSYETGTMTLAAGDAAVLFTDGIPEGRNDKGEDYGRERLERLVRENQGLPAAGIRGRIVDDTRGYSCGAEHCDDITVVVVKRTAVGA